MIHKIALHTAGALTVLIVGVGGYAYVQNRLERQHQQQLIRQAQEAMNETQHHLGAYAQLPSNFANVPKVAEVNLPTTTPEENEINFGGGSITIRTKLQNFNGLDIFQREVAADFELVRDSVAGIGAPGAGGFVRVRGIGSFKLSSESTKYKTNTKCLSEAQMDGHGSNYENHGELTISSSMIYHPAACQMVSFGRVSDVTVGADPGAVCTFHAVDFAKGGHYSAHPEGEAVWSAGTECVLELRAPRK